MNCKHLQDRTRSQPRTDNTNQMLQTCPETVAALFLPIFSMTHITKLAGYEAYLL